MIVYQTATFNSLSASQREEEVDLFFRRARELLDVAEPVVVEEPLGFPFMVGAVPFGLPFVSTTILFASRRSVDFWVSWKLVAAASRMQRAGLTLSPPLQKHV